MMDASSYSYLLMILLFVILSISYIGSLYFVSISLLFTFDAYKRWIIDYIKYKIYKRKQL